MRDDLFTVPGIGREQDLGALERADGMPPAAQQSRQFAALDLTQLDPIAYIHGGLPGLEAALNRIGSVCHPSSDPSFTDRQGQYLAFIYAYTRVNRRPPAEADMQRYFQVSPPPCIRWCLPWNAPVSSGDSLGWHAVSKCWWRRNAYRSYADPNRQNLCERVLGQP